MELHADIMYMIFVYYGAQIRGEGVRGSNRLHSEPKKKGNFCFYTVKYMACNKGE